MRYVQGKHHEQTGSSAHQHVGSQSCRLAMGLPFETDDAANYGGDYQFDGLTIYLAANPHDLFLLNKLSLRWWYEPNFSWQSTPTLVEPERTAR
jgi:hypothetical protein